jgi:hypothetical protein
LAAWQADLVADLGGAESVSTAQRQVIDLATWTKVIVDSIDAWILERGSLVNGRRRAVYPVILQRQQLADALARYLTALGLERRQAEPKSLQAYLAERYGGPAGESPPSDGSGHPGAAPPVRTPNEAPSAPPARDLEGSSDPAPRSSRPWSIARSLPPASIP